MTHFFFAIKPWSPLYTNSIVKFQFRFPFRSLRCITPIPKIHVFDSLNISPIYIQADRFPIDFEAGNWWQAIDACSRAGQPEEAIKILQQMQKHRIAPDVVALSSIINAFSQLGKVRREVRSMSPSRCMSLVFEGCCCCCCFARLQMQLNGFRKQMSLDWARTSLRTTVLSTPALEWDIQKRQGETGTCRGCRVVWVSTSIACNIGTM